MAWAIYCGLFALMAALKGAAVTSREDTSLVAMLIWLGIFVFSASECAKSVHEWHTSQTKP